LSITCLAALAAPVATVEKDALPPGALARLGPARFRSGSAILSFAYAPDGKTLATAGPWDNWIGVWDAATGRLLHHLSGHTNGVMAVHWSPDGKYLASGGGDRVIRVWDAAGLEVRALSAGRIPIQSLAWSPDGKALLSASQEPVARLWEVATGRELRQFGAGDKAITSIAFAPDGRHVATGGQDGKVRLWDAEAAKEVRQLVSGRDGAAPGALSLTVRQLAFSPDGKVLGGAVGGGTTLCLWDVDQGVELRRFGDPQRAVLSFAFSPSGKFLAAAGFDRVRVWGLTSGKELRQLEPARDRRAPPLGPVAFSPDGKTLAAVGEASQTILLWDLTDSRERFPPSGHLGPVEALAFLPGGKRLVSAGRDGTLRLWDWAAGAEVEHLTDAGPVPTSLGVAPDGKTILYSTLTHPSLGQLCLWKPGTGKVIRQLDAGQVPPGASRPLLSPDGRLAVVNRAADQAVLLFNTATGKVEHELKGPRYAADAAFTPDGGLLAYFGQDALIHVWDTASGKPVRQLAAGGRRAPGLALSPDGRTAAYAAIEIHLLEVATGSERGRLPRPAGTTFTLAFSPDGQLAALGGTDGTVSVYALTTGKEVARLTGHSAAVRTLAFSPDGKALASAGHDHTILVWDAALLSRTARLPTADLSADALAALWAELAGGNGVKAYRAVWALTADPARAVAFLKDRLKAMPAGDVQRLAQLIADLDADKFAVREKATQELEALGRAAEPALQKALQGQPGLEARRRINELLGKVKGVAAGGDAARQARALEALELMGTAEARQLLEALAKGEADDPLTQDAKKALRRLAGRSMGD
jgi:WD40 repeat protein